MLTDLYPKRLRPLFAFTGINESVLQTKEGKRQESYVTNS